HLTRPREREGGHQRRVRRRRTRRGGRGARGRAFVARGRGLTRISLQGGTLCSPFRFFAPHTIGGNEPTSVQHAVSKEGPIRARASRKGRDVPVRADGLQ